MKKINQLNGIKGLFPALKARKGKVILILSLSLVDAALSLLPIQIVGAIVDVLSTGTSMLSTMIGDRLELYVLLFAAIYLLKHAINIFYGSEVSILSFGIVESIREDAMRWTMHSFKPYKESMKEGDITSRISGDVEAVIRAVAGPLNGLLPMLLKMLGSLIIIMVWNPTLGAIALFLMVPLFFASRSIAIKSKEIASEQRAAVGTLVGAVSDVLFSMPIIKAWQSEQFESAHFHEYSHAIFLLNKKNQKAFNVYWCITYMLMAVGNIAAIALATYSASAGIMTIGSITVAYSYLSNVLTPAVSLSRYGNDLFQADAALARVFALKPQAEEENIPSLQLQGAPQIAFEGVSIACNASRTIEGLTFTAKPHRMLVLAGESGSGKSTIINTLLGNQTPLAGKILVDGVDMTHQLCRLRSAISVSFQQACLFDRSLGENVAYACPAPDLNRAKDALHHAGLQSLLEERGLGFQVGTKGKALSGGEQRRVSFSRALYKTASIYIFDEPTAEMDAESGRMILSRLLDLKKDATIIVASHDPQVIEQADAVVYLNQQHG